MTKTAIKSILPQDTWDIRHRVMWPYQPFDFVKLPEDEDGLHFGLFVGERLTSIVSVFVNGDDFQFRKLATEADQQGKGYGTQLLRHVMEEAIQRKVKRVWCNARVDKTSYYERFGLYQTDERYSKGGIDFVIIEKLL